MSLPVLVVEDDDTLRSVISFQMKHLGLECLVAKDGAQALELFAKHRVALVLMDVQMPAMDGLEASRAIRQIEEEEELSRTPIVAVTASPDRERCYQAGMNDFLFKPVSISELQKVIDRWIRES